MRAFEVLEEEEVFEEGPAVAAAEVVELELAAAGG